MDLQLEGKRALVTGSSSGIGEAIAKTLAKEGAMVVVHGRREKEVERVAQEISSRGGKATFALGDLSKDADATSIAEKALAAFGSIDILVNNAGVYTQKSWFEIAAAEWNEIYNQNVSSMVRMIQLLVPGMKERHWGRAIAIASGVATIPDSFTSSYSASKAAIVNLAVSLSKDLAGTGVTSNALSPGMILTPAVEQYMLRMASQMGWPDNLASMEINFVNQFFPNLPNRRLGRVEDIAGMVAFLCSPIADYVNGANIRVDGGYVPTVN